jgi:hypothetical protein
MAYDVTWRVSDRAALQRQFELLFAKSDRRDGIAEGMVEQFITDVSLYPVEWPVSSEPPAVEDWRFGRVSVRFKRYPSDQLIEVLEIRAD